MANSKRTVLVLDDDEINLMILVKCAQDAGYTAKPFTSSLEALDYMQHNPDDFDIAVLDKMMPGMNGIDLLKRMKDTETLRHVPVIIQTGDAGVEQMREGISSGAYYYLTKPFHPEILNALLHAAANDCMAHEVLSKQAGDGGEVVRMLQKGEFLLRTHDEARRICAVISQVAVYPEFVMVGLMELLANAVEHGNLGIGYEKKRTCLMNGTWEQEVAARMGNPEFSGRMVRIQFEKTRAGLYLIVCDQGIGFDWRSQADHLALLKLNEPSGRGISKAMVMLDDVRYVGCGNEVHCSIKLQTPLSLSHNDNSPSTATPRKQA